MGGDSEARRLLRIDNVGMDIRNIAWGAAWDAFYFCCMQHSDLSGVDILEFKVVKHFVILVTADKAMAGIISKCSVYGGVKMDGVLKRTIVASSFDYPHFMPFAPRDQSSF